MEYNRSGNAPNSKQQAKSTRFHIKEQKLTWNKISLRHTQKTTKKHTQKTQADSDQQVN